MPLPQGRLLCILDQNKHAFSFLLLFPHCKYKILYTTFGYNQPCFMGLCFIELYRYLKIFYKWKVCGNSVLINSISAFFFKSICSLHISVSHFGNSPTVSNVFITTVLSLHLLWWFESSDLWCYYWNINIVLELHKPHPYKTTNLIDKCCVCSDSSTIWLFPHLPPFSGLPILWHTTVLKLGQLLWPQGATPPPRSSCCPGTGGPRGTTPHSGSGGAAVRRYPHPR